MIEFDDIQGWVIRLYKFTSSESLFARIDDPGAARRWLGDHCDELTTAASFDPEMRSTLNVAFSARGLEALGAPREFLDEFQAPFREGMAARWERLGDVDASDPGYWCDGFRDGGVHVLVTVHVRVAAEAEEIVRGVRTGIEASGMRVVHSRPAAQLEGAREHFGFSDGFSQPAVDGVFGEEHRPGQGTPTAHEGEWRPLALGEFVLGYVDEDGVLPYAPPAPFDRNSSFMAWRQLEQDVHGFHNYCRDRSGLFPGGAAHVAAKMVGRWPDGSPLVLSPHAPDEQLGSDPQRVNNFRYDRDPEGRRCPIGAHVRRTNPRDAFGFEGRLSRRHRIIRRGMSYGPPASDPPRKDGVERGLAFVCFQADLDRQFETVQAGWCADGDAFGLDTAKDPILANDDPDGVFVVPGSPPVFLGPLQNFVTVRGGEYLIAPGRRAVGAIAEDKAW